MVTAAQIKRARAKAGETQTAFAARFPVDQSTLHRWERKGPPKRKPIQDWIANVLEQTSEAVQAAE